LVDQALRGDFVVFALVDQLAAGVVRVDGIGAHPADKSTWYRY
jgi:hypothetical protein